MLANTLSGLVDLLIQKGQPSSAVAHIDEALQILSHYPQDAFAQSLAKDLQEKRSNLL